MAAVLTKFVQKCATKKLTLVTTAVVAAPLVAVVAGFRLRRLQAKEVASPANRRVFRVTELPIYVPEESIEWEDVEPSPFQSNSMERAIGAWRRSALEQLNSLQANTDNCVRAVAVSLKDVWMSLHDNPADVLCVGLVLGSGCLAGLVAYRYDRSKAATYALLAGSCCTAVCNPGLVMDLDKRVSGHAADLMLLYNWLMTPDLRKQVDDLPGQSSHEEPQEDSEVGHSGGLLDLFGSEDLNI